MLDMRDLSSSGVSEILQLVLYTHAKQYGTR